MGDGWQDGRLEATHREARAVMEGQREVIADVDAKAMYTVRVIVVVVGIVVAAARIGGPGIFDVRLLTAGLGTLLLSLGLGVATYSESNPFLGPNRTYIRQLVEADVDTDTWEADVCLRMGDWTAENDGSLRLNARLLFLTQTSLLCGVALLVGAVAF